MSHNLTSRRNFVGAAAAGIAAPIILRADDKTGNKKPVIGEGAYKYEVTHDWGELPSHIKWGNTHGVCEDSQGNIYVHHTVHATSESADSVVVFDKKGKFVRSWGKEFRGVAHGIHVRKEGSTEYIYLSVNVANPRLQPPPPLSAAIVKTTLKGEIVWKIQGPPNVDAYKPGPDGTPKRYSPTNLVIAPNGDIYVGDGYGSSYISQYTSKAEHIRTFAGPGKEVGQLSTPHGITIDKRGKEPMLLVADRANARLHYFTLDGKPENVVTGFTTPCDFSEHKGLIVIPELNARVMLLDRKNQVAAILGEDKTGNFRQLRTQPRESFSPGKFICPHGACFDHDGNIFVVEWVEIGRVTKLRHVS